MRALVHRLFLRAIPGDASPRDRVAQQIASVTIFFLGMTSVCWAVLLFAYPTFPGQAIPSLLLLPVMVGVLILARQRRVTAACYLLVIGLWVTLIIIAASSNGVSSPAYVGLLIVTLAAGLVFGIRAAVICAAASILAGLALLLLSQQRILPPASPWDDLTLWLTTSFMILSAVAILQITTRNILHTLREVEQQLQERDEAERALSDREARLRSLTVAIPDLVLTISHDGRYLDVYTENPHVLTAPREQLLGRNIRDILPEEVASRAMQAISHAIANGSIQEVEYELTTQAGQRWFQARVAPFSSTGTQSVIWLARDITERRQAEARLREREQIYRQAIIAANAVPYHRDFRTETYTYMGKGIYEITGYHATEMTPTLLESLVIEHHMRGDMIHLSVEQAAMLARAGNLKEWRSDSLIRTRSGDPRWIADSAVQVSDAEGTVIGTFGILQDITERKRTEEQLRQAQKLQAVGQLAGGLAHDFNNLLTVINSYSSIMRDQIEKEQLPAWLRRDLDQIAHAGERAATLTRQLLAFSRRQVLTLRILSLNEVLSSILPMLSRLTSESIDLQTSLAPDLFDVRADSGQLEQVIINLVVNARDAMPRGGTLTITTRNIDISQAYALRISDIEPGDYAALAVSDTGVGMEADVQSRIFEPFFTTKESGHGTGLGLATAHGIIAQMGGRIRFVSERGRGTTFTIYLPRTAQTEQPRLADPPPVSSTQGRGTILLVDDDPAIRRVVRTILERHGYSVLDGLAEEAEQISADHIGAIDLLLTDVVMPGTDGASLAQRLIAGRPAMRVLFMSGYTDSIVVQHGVLDGSSAFIQKPFMPGTLIETVRSVLEAR
jgi:two-component system, cell cycle sensor histidine kinase and response regulator CckA